MFLFLLKEKWYPYFFVLARIWAKSALFGTGFYYKIDREQKFEANKSYMLIANHTSMTDIMLMLAVSNQPFVFVGKIELAKIPLFGFFYKRSCILVDRSNSRSRMEVFEQAQKRLKQGLSICIFPEGGVPTDESIVLADFKDGAFRLSIGGQIPIVAMTCIGAGELWHRKSMHIIKPGKLEVYFSTPFRPEGKTEEDIESYKEAVKAEFMKYLRVYYPHGYV